MMSREYGHIVFSCDNCQDVLETGERHFEEAKHVYEVEGWHRRLMGQVWEHYCPACKGFYR